MKKNKTIAYMLAATLLVGGTFLGTKAWFSAQVETDNGIKITMGTLDLELDETKTGSGANLIKGWELVRKTEDTESTTGGRHGEIGNEFTEIRPGDTFVREFTITNTGSLDQIISLDNYSDKETQDKIFKFTIESIKDQDNKDISVINNEFRLNADKHATVKLVLVPDAEALDNKYNAGNNIFDLNQELGKITVTGRQINATDTQLSSEHITNQK